MDAGYNGFYGDNSIELDLIRRDFPLTRKKVYMNNGAIAPIPISTIKSITDFLLKCSEDGPDSKIIYDYIVSLMKELRTRITHMINCDPNEIVFTQSTTEGLNYVCNGLDWKRTDSIIVRGGPHEHYANYLPWLQLSKRKGVKINELEIDENGYFDFTNLEKLAKKKNTKLITLSHALYNSGAIMPVEETGKIARENNILYCIDAAQTVGSIEVDVKKIGCDFMAFPGFKWLCGPVGIGIFYCSKNAGEILIPQSIGGESAILSDQKVIAYVESPQKFQTGFRNYPGVAGLESSLRYILRLGIANIHNKNIKIANILRSELVKIPGIKIYGPEDEKTRTSIIPFSSSNSDAKNLVDKLEQNEIIFAERDIGGGKKIVRASPHFFNSEED
ncbi:MAG: aminotransferase class V-fold PLP-dependent enzyme, partial [Thermoproteota archaeon]|nr:aminotransferase class V-fold PLP-dependent enzyme [Thermoproteota archaeon]